jgi:hypothetical protein
MGVSGFDLVVLGVLVSVGGGLFLAGRYRRGPARSEAAPAAAKDSDPIAVRDGIIRHAEVMAGVRWLTIGLLALFLGATRGGESAYLVGFWSDILLHVAVLSLCWLATLVRVKRQSRQRYLPRMIELHRKGFDTHAEHLSHDGYNRYEIEQGVVVAESLRRLRLAEGARRLDQIGQALDVFRTAGESDRHYVERLRPFFAPATR